MLKRTKFSWNSEVILSFRGIFNCTHDDDVKDDVSVVEKLYYMMSPKDLCYSN